ncbi:MAG: SurA N-terminal domain-containing protein, partial [Candidatus Binatota bacterium]|nr:SurA N-terminal domain-containing protein [Candidatus Binatota bacterium]
IERYREMLKGQLTEEMIKGLNLKGNIVENLVQKKLVLQEAQSLGLLATDDDVAHQLAKVPEFQVAGRFNKERYLQLLQANRLQPAQFEEDQRNQITLQRLYNIIIDSVQVSDAEVRERYRLDQEKINLQFVKLSANDFASQVKLTDEDSKKFYDRNKETFKEPLKIQVEYLTYPFEQFAADAQVNAKEIEEYYQNNQKSKFHRPREAKIRYITLAIAPTASAEEKKSVLAKAEAIIKEARRGKDFAQLAKKDSADPTAAKGGDVGWVVQGQMPPAIDKLIFGIGKGDVSDPVETAGSVQIFKIDDVRAEKNLTLKEATAEITQILKTDQARKAAGKVADNDRVKALAGTEFTKLAQASGIAARETKLFAAGEILPEFGQNQDIYKIAFGLGQKDVSQIVEANSAYIFLRLKQRKEPVVPPLESIKEQVEKGAKEAKAYELALQKGNSLLDQLKKEKDLAKLAGANDLRAEETGWFQRSAPQLPKIGDLAELRGESLSVSAQKPVADRLYTQKDAAYILAFKESQPADMEQFEKEKILLKKQALVENRQRALAKYLETLKAKAKINFNNDFLEAS